MVILVILVLAVLVFPVLMAFPEFRELLPRLARASFPVSLGHLHERTDEGKNGLMGGGVVLIGEKTETCLPWLREA